ncbi:MAG TPA: GWxTD domain-containing protein [Blastocatellia bacterium]|nr:GWxTD domain-containing protein [Blastocatellia bacterium]
MKRDVFLFRRIVGVFLVLMLSAGILPGVVAGQKDKDKSQDKAAKDRNEKKKKDELKSVYKKWMDEDVPYIITEEERKAFKQLKTDEERDQFIEQFWLRRDPDPDTPENEYKDEYFQRIEYANEKFTSGIAGWRTDRGRIYIMFGKPDELESHPAGGQYERPSYEGGGSTSTYPFETWWYRYIEGIGSDVEIEFVDPSGSGEYRIARSPDEKDALLNVPGAGLTLAESLGMANKADRVAGGGGLSNSTGGNNQMFAGRAKDQPFERLQLLADLQRAPAIKFRDLEVKADLPEIASDVLPFSVRTDFFRIGVESVATSFTMQFDNADLSMKNQGGIYSGQVNIYAKLTALSGRRAATFEDVVATQRYGEDQLQAGQTQRSIYQKNIVLPPGRYKIDVVGRDTVSGKTGILHHSFEVPRYQEKQFATSTLILAASIEPLDNKSIPAGQFIIGRYKVKPFVSGVYKPGQNLALFLQVYDADMDQATLQPALKVEYSISKGGQEIAHISEDGKSKLGLIDMKGQQLVIARAIPLVDKLAEPGTYTITARITDLVSQKVVTPQAQYTVLNR